MEKVSIIVPIYNVEMYLKRCIESIINQTYKNIEIILVDDGSPDNCGNICDYYKLKDNRIVVVHKKNGGLSDARNYGLDISTGQYIIFIDSDDYVKENFVEYLINDIKKSNADISICDYIKDFEGKFKYNTYSKKKFICSNKEKFENLYNEFYVASVVQWNKIFKKEIFNGLRFPVNKINEDEFIIGYEFYNAKKISYNLEPLYYYFQRKDSIMANFKINRFDIVEAYKERNIFFEKNNLVNSVKIGSYHIFNTILTLCAKSYEFYFSIDDQLTINDYILENKKYAKRVLKEKELFKRKIKCLLYLLCPLFVIFVTCRKKIFFLKKRIRLIKNFVEDFFITILILLKTLYKKDKIYILGVPNHGNLGDQAIMLAEEEFVKNNFKNKKTIGIYSRLILRFPNIYKYIIGKSTILYTGGGFLGSLWKNEEDRFRTIIQLFKKNKIIALPQTFYFSDDNRGEYELKKSINIYSSHPNLILVCREKTSYELMKKKFTKNKILMLPDMVLSMRQLNYNNKRENIIICMRNDKEKTMGNIDKIISFLKENGYNNPKLTDTVINYNINSLQRKKRVYEKLIEFSKCEIVITDRLHGMIFAYLTRTPCLVFNSKSYKLKGVYQWIKECKYIIFTNQISFEDDFKKIKDIKVNKNDKNIILDFSLLKKVIENE